MQPARLSPGRLCPRTTHKILSQVGKRLQLPRSATLLSPLRVSPLPCFSYASADADCSSVVANRPADCILDPMQSALLVFRSDAYPDRGAQQARLPTSAPLDALTRIAVTGDAGGRAPTLDRPSTAQRGCCRPQHRCCGDVRSLSPGPKVSIVSFMRRCHLSLARGAFPALAPAALLVYHHCNSNVSGTSTPRRAL